MKSFASISPTDCLGFSKQRCSLRMVCGYGTEVFILLLILVQFASVSAYGQDSPRSSNPSSDSASRCDIDQLLRDMTVEEKLGQMQLLDGFEDGRFRPEQLVMAKKGLLGGVFNVRSAHLTNELQRAAVERSRLKIPLLFAYDVLHGYRTIFPIPLGLASTWNPRGVSLAAKLSALEARAAGIRLTFAPMLDIARDPRWGRIAESPGEDPYLASVFAKAWVEGFQIAEPTGKESSELRHLKFAACAKHFVAYGAAEGGRDYNTVDISDRTLREIYLPPFNAAVSSGVSCVMTSANELNGIPAVVNNYTINTILRHDWQFNGLVMSDFNSLFELQNHGVASSPREAAELALAVGLDIDLVSGYFLGEGPRLVYNDKQRLIAIDNSVRRILKLKSSLGLFENPFSDEASEASSILTTQARAVAKEMAIQSLVLLKNSPAVLPLDHNHTIAIIGPHARSKADLLGPWSADGRGSETLSLAEAMARRCAVADCILTPAEQTLNSAIDIARRADMVLLALGETRDMTGEAASRASIELAEEQVELWRNIAKSGKPHIVIIFSGRPLAIPEIAERAPAIIQAWFPGTMGATAVTDILFGEASPSAKLPVSIPRSTGQIPVYYNHKATGRPFQASNRYTSKYIDEQNEPLFPFGFGLSYTRFDLKDLEVHPHRQFSLRIQVKLTNIGKRSGIETVQLYVRRASATVTRPIRELKGFSRVELRANEQQTLTFILDPKSLSYLDKDLRPVAPSSCFNIEVGTSSIPGLSQTYCAQPTPNPRRP